MPAYLHPGTYIEEVQGATPIIAASTSIAAFLGTALKGPVDEPGFFTSYDDARRRYGDPDPDRGELMYAVQGFFQNGGQQCWVGRLAHYSDIDDASTITGVIASTDTDIVSEIGAASSAQVTGSVAGPTFNLEPAWHLDIDLNNAGVAVATFSATAGARTGTAGTFNTTFAGGETLTVIVDGGVEQTVIFTSAAQTALQVAAEINTQLQGASSVVSGGQIRITSDRRGSGSSVSVTGGTGRATIGLSVAATSGTGNVSNIEAVTLAELETVIEAAIVGLVVSGSTASHLVLTSPTTGTASEIDIKVASTAGLLTALGLTVAVTAGSASAVQHCLTITAADYGELGNDYSVTLVDNPVFTSLGVNLDLYTGLPITIGDSIIYLAHGEGLRAGVMLRISDGTHTEHREVLSVEKVIVGSAIKHAVTLTSTTTYGYVVAATTVESLEFDVQVYYKGTLVETWSQVTMLDTADNYIETVINDEISGSLVIRAVDENSGLGEGADKPAAGDYAFSGGTDEASGIVTADVVGSEEGHTGIHLFDDLDNVSLLCIPGKYDAALVQQVMTWVEARKDLFYLVGPQAGRTRDQMSTYRQVTGGFECKYAGLYWPRIEVVDPVGVGNNPTRVVDPVGHIAGVYARVDSMAPPNGGVWNTPAGTGDYGRLVGTVALETQVRDADQDVLNPIGVNCLRKFNGVGIVIFGGRTLSSDPDWRYISVRRLFIFVEQSLAKSGRAYLFRNNDFRTWATLSDEITRFLRGVWQAGGLKGATTAESFFVQIDGTTTTPADVDAGRLISKVGLAAQKPAEFIIFQLSQFDGSTTVTE